MAWQQIAASETDANSPLNQTLMDKIRGNLDYLRSVSAQMKFLKGFDTGDGTPRDVVLDDTMDWRDRYIEVLGNATIHNKDEEYLPGGADDDELGSRYDTINASDVVGLFKSEWMYTSAGGANKTTDPYIHIEDLNNGNDDVYIWVNSANGNLIISMSTIRAAGFRNLAWNLRIVYSEDQGGH
jgi:hypothetical protein